MAHIGTHDGTFHCDEALACYLLKLLPEYAGSTVVRTRDPEILKTCNIVVDVGGVFDPANHRYDHHQREFAGTMRTLGGLPFDTRLSSAGLIYAHFGKRIIAQVAGTDDATTNLLYERLYGSFVEEIDAVDNGVSQYDGAPRYKVTSTLSQRVARLAPSWNEPQQPAHVDTQFSKACTLAGEEFLTALRGLHMQWLPARQIVQDAVANRFQTDASGEIIRLAQFCPWKSHLYDIEEELKASGTPINVKYAIFQDQSGSWRVCCVSVHESAFENRLGLPDAWRGLRDDKLSEVAGVPGCIFVHATGFIGGAKTEEATLGMARKALAAGAGQAVQK